MSEPPGTGSATWSLHLSQHADPLALSAATTLDGHYAPSQARSQFIIPTRADLTKTSLAPTPEEGDCTTNTTQDAPAAALEPCTYLCGNSLGLQPKATRSLIDSYLTTWATQGVQGHFKPLADSQTQPWLHLDDQAAQLMAPIVGASSDEVAVMQTLTANLHFLLASFYAPTQHRHAILIEDKAFPSDHFAAQSHIAHHGYDPDSALLLLQPDEAETHNFSTQHVLDTIDKHANQLALILLPAVHFYTGQLLDVARITAHARSHGIPIGWDCAHAAGNVPLKLHDWGVDFAAWCTYKYLNSGPGCTGALFVHQRHSAQRRLCGWWGSSKDSRFDMANRFEPRSGAKGWQMSNPSVADLTAVVASLRVFNSIGMSALRTRSEALTGYLEHLLQNWPLEKRPYRLLTPHDAQARGAQISVRLEQGLLQGIMEDLQEAGVVLDERKPDVIRVAPAPLYNSFQDVWHFMNAFASSIQKRC